MRHVLVINGGSTSIKFALFGIDGEPRQVMSGVIERIGHHDGVFRLVDPDHSGDIERGIDVSDHRLAVDFLTAWIQQRVDARSLAAIGHRVVHGGPSCSAPRVIDRALLEELARLAPVDPAHLPSEIRLIEAFQIHFPALPQIACFDTHFHRHLPRVAQLLAIPLRYHRQGVRRYGFHGLSFEFMMGELQRIAGQARAPQRVILAHLGGGCSLAAVADGRCIDTSMGFTPSAGLPMSTRSGDLDPGLIGYLARTEGMSPAGFDRMVTAESGLLGLSETSADLRDLLERESSDARAADAVDYFCYHVRKGIGAFAAALGGVDALVFAGGIGENAAPIRARICGGLRFLGLALDEQTNRHGEPIISSSDSVVAVHVMRTDEALIVARAVCRELSL